MGIISDFIGTFSNYLKVGKGGIRLTNSSGVCNIENANGTAKANLGAHTINLHGSNASFKTTLTSASGLSSDVNLVLPSSDGSPGQVFVTDGDGNISFADAVSNGEMCQEEAFTQATSSPVTIFTPPANAVITMVQIEVSSAATAGTPTVSVGISGDTDRDMDEEYSDLLAVGVYEASPLTYVGATPAAIILTILPDSQTFSGKVRVWYVVPA
jgi:hypothetical protein